jgi:hypothetical protein
VEVVVKVVEPLVVLIAVELVVEVVVKVVVEVVAVVPTKPLKQFLLYFDKVIRPMTPAQKEKFMKK